MRWWVIVGPALIVVGMLIIRHSGGGDISPSTATPIQWTSFGVGAAIGPAIMVGAYMRKLKKG